MRAHRAIPKSGSKGRAIGWSTLILAVTAAYLAVGLGTYAAWQISGNAAWIDDFFRVPGSLLMVSLSLVQVVFAWRVRGQFSRGEPLYAAWQLIALSAACDFVATLAIQIFSNLGSNSRSQLVRQCGLTVGGPVRFALLAAGLLFALQVYRRSGFLGRLAAVDWVLLAGAVLYVMREFWDLWIALQHGKKPDWAEIANWPVDPLLCLLLAEAMLLHRSARRMGPGWVGRCWRAFSAGIVLVVLGNVSIWAAAYGYLPYPWSNIGWYVWLPASAAFAIAPVYQMEVIQKAGGERC